MSYHAGPWPGSAAIVADADLSNDQGSIRLTVVPAFGATPQDPITGEDYTLLDFGGVSRNERLWWRGTVGDSGAESYFALSIANVVVARFYSRHEANDVLDIEIGWGGTPSRAHLIVNGQAAVKDSVLPTLPFSPLSGSLAVGSDIFGQQVFDGTISDVYVTATRNVPTRRIAFIGDSLTQEPADISTGRLKTWSRVVGQALLDNDRDGYVWNAGKNSDTIDLNRSRLAGEVLTEGVDMVVQMIGINDIIADASFAEMQADELAFIDACSDAGVPLVLVTPPPFGESVLWSAPRQAVWDAWVAWILTVPSGVLRVYDGASLLTEPGSDPPEIRNTSPYFWAYFDGLHLSDAGYLVLGQGLRDADVLDLPFITSPDQSVTVTSVPTRLRLNEMARGDDFKLRVTYAIDGDLSDAQIRATWCRQDVDSEGAAIFTLANDEAGGSTSQIEVIDGPGGVFDVKVSGANWSSWTTLRSGDRRECTMDVEVVFADGRRRTPILGRQWVFGDSSR